MKGNYQETSYQETFVFDILQFTDSLRHSIMKGDKVLAPCEDNDDLYCPGTVIEGQEARESSTGSGSFIIHPIMTIISSCG